MNGTNFSKRTRHHNTLNRIFSFSDENNLVDNIKNAQGKYITFTKESDMIDPNYLSTIKNKVLEDFDCCYINHVIDYDYKNVRFYFHLLIHILQR